MAIKYLFAGSIRRAFCLTSLMLALMATGAAVAEGQEKDGSAQALTQKELMDRLCFYRERNESWVVGWNAADRNGRYSSGNGAIGFAVDGTYTEVANAAYIKGKFTVTDTEITFEAPNAFPATKRYTIEGNILTLTEKDGEVKKFQKNRG